MSGMSALAVLFVACGSVDGGKPDAPPLMDSPVADVPPPCAGIPFSSSAPVASISGATDDMYFRLSEDELSAVLSIKVNGTPQLYAAARSSVTAQFSAPAPLMIAGNSGGDIDSPSLSADGLSLYFVSNRIGTTGLYDIWRATRSATSALFGDVVTVSELSSTADESDVFVVPNHNAIYFSSARNAAVYSVFRASRSGLSFTAPVEVLHDRPYFVSRVVVNSDERILFYQKGNDIHETYRASTAEPFSHGTLRTELNTSAADQPTWTSPDGCRLYFMTNRPGSLGGFDIHVAVRSRSNVHN